MTREDAIYWVKNLAVLATEKDMPQIEEALTMAVEALQDRKTEPQTDYRIQGTIGYRCPKCGRGNFLKNKSNCVYCGEPLIKDEPQTSGKPYKIEASSVCKVELQSNILLDAMAKAFGVEDEPQTDCAWKKGE